MRNNNKTKIIATLGVVAGLGLAAFPAFSYAAEVSGDVQIDTAINPAIAMRIHSNADDTYGFIGYNPATAQGPTDPAAVAGPSEATGLTLSSNQSNTTALYSNIEVRSNTGQFKLEVADNDTDTAMRNATSSATTNQYIPAGVTTKTEAGETVIDPTVAGWALKGGDIANWSAIVSSEATPLTVKAAGTNTTNPLAYSDQITVNYAVASGLTKTDTYSDTITYTATVTDTALVDPFADCGRNEGDTCTVSNTEFKRLKDGRLWTTSSQGDTTWTTSANRSSVHEMDASAIAMCTDLGADFPTAQDFVDLIVAYGGAAGYSAAPYGYNDRDGDVQNATGWSGIYWTATEYAGNTNNAWTFYTAGNTANLFGDDTSKGDSFQVLCVH